MLRIPSFRPIAFYLPQYHPIPENNAWWGPGFTEWTNVTKARPLFRGHDQPRLPADLGFYDLRVAESRAAQAELARNAGIEAFCYYHYWFAGKRLLERPFSEVLASGAPDFPFCLCWANQTWSGIWHGNPQKILIEQTYPGPEDDEAHFLAILPALKDRRYLTVNGQPIFVVFRPHELPDPRGFIGRWQDLARRHSLPELHFVAHLFGVEKAWDYRAAGFDAAVIVSSLKGNRTRPESLFITRWRRSGHLPHPKERRLARLQTIRNYLWYCALRVRGRPTGAFRNIVDYADAVPFFLDGFDQSSLSEYPCAIPNWDNTPRSHQRGFVLHDANPLRFEGHLREVAASVSHRTPEQRLVFIKSWNEWAEGNYLEPDRRFGHGYLDAVRKVVYGPESDGQARPHPRKEQS